MATTIQISREVKERLEAMKISPSETYEDVIMDLIESVTELSEETKRALRMAEKDVEEGKIHTLDRVKKELGL